jgi:hypothetical protein
MGGGVLLYCDACLQKIQQSSVIPAKGGTGLATVYIESLAPVFAGVTRVSETQLNIARYTRTLRSLHLPL